MLATSNVNRRSMMSMSTVIIKSNTVTKPTTTTKTAMNRSFYYHNNNKNIYSSNNNITANTTNTRMMMTMMTMMTKGYNNNSNHYYRNNNGFFSSNTMIYNITATAIVGLMTIAGGPSTTIASCEGSNNNIYDLLFPKNNDGTINWNKSSGQITDSIFWDQFGKVTGSKVQQQKKHTLLCLFSSSSCLNLCIIYLLILTFYMPPSHFRFVSFRLVSSRLCNFIFHY